MQVSSVFMTLNSNGYDVEKY